MNLFSLGALTLAVSFFFFVSHPFGLKNVMAVIWVKITPLTSKHEHAVLCLPLIDNDKVNPLGGDLLLVSSGKHYYLTFPVTGKLF